MKFRIYSIALCAALLLAAGCKDDDDTKPYLSGEVQFEKIPAYVVYGDNFHREVTGAYGSGSELVGYRLYDPITALSDTLRHEGQSGDVSFDYTVSKDTTGTFTLTVYAFCTGYYGLSKSGSFTIVNPSLGQHGSLTNHPFGTSLVTFQTDSRDGARYYTTNAGGKEWMAQNLHYAEARKTDPKGNDMLQHRFHLGAHYQGPDGRVFWIPVMEDFNMRAFERKDGKYVGTMVEIDPFGDYARAMVEVKG